MCLSLASRVVFFLFVYVFFVQAKCLVPAVRREWRSISESERVAWISAVKCLAKLPHSNSLVRTQDLRITQIPGINTTSSYYDDLSYVHMDLNPIIHHTGLFFPWHRAFVYALELKMKEKCGYDGSHPYWDWTMDTSDFQNSSIFDPSPTSGFGGWGNPELNLPIMDGAFGTDFVVSYPSPHHIYRNYTRQPWLGSKVVYPDGSALSYNTSAVATDSFTKASQDAIVNGFIGDFMHFQAAIEGILGSHAAVHRTIGGDMAGACPPNSANCIPGNKWSPNDPLFYMHHAMVDKLWYDWQHTDPANFWSFTGGSNATSSSLEFSLTFPNGGPPFLNFGSQLPDDGVLPDFTIYDVMDTKGGSLCYIYK